MKTYLECIPCFFKQALEATRIAGVGEVKQKEVIIELCKLIPNFSLEATPPEMGRVLYKLIKEITGEEDPFKEIKQRNNELALSLYPNLKKKVKDSQDKLLTAIILAITGNVIDYGAKSSLNIEEEINNCLNNDIDEFNKAIFDYPQFRDALNNSKTILYLGDNSGEIVFDRILIEEILKEKGEKKEIIFAVRDKPVINDALIEDAYICGIDKIAKVISSGSDAPGTILKYCSNQFLQIYKTSDMIISKGQGNFETLSNEDRQIFFLFKVKCNVIAKEVLAYNKNCKVGDIILKRGEE